MDPTQPAPGGPGEQSAPGGPACSRCPRPAVERVRYAGVHLCRAHFLAFVRRRVKRTIRDQGGIPSGSRLGVAVSGGKDSVAALRLLHEILRPRLAPGSGGKAPRGDVELVAITADEGIAGYREEGLEVARATARALGVEHRVADYKARFGATMDEVHTVKGDQNECSFCGVFRRHTLNETAKEAGCTHLVTGHNLDDTAQAVLMNLTTGDPGRLARLGPHPSPKDGLVPRLLPLRWIPEREVALTVLLEGWPADTRECPYAVNAQRGLYRDLLLRLEQAQPGTRHALLRTLDALRPALASLDGKAGPGLGTCRVCNGPASGEVCQTCRLGRLVQDRLGRLGSEVVAQRPSIGGATVRR